jgi:hypothetical protein
MTEHSPIAEPSPGDDSLLDNSVWHALAGPLSRFAARHSMTDLVHFDPEVSVFSAVDRTDDAMWQRIGDLVGVDDFCGLFRDVVESPPDGWEELFGGPCWQRVAGPIPEPSGLEVVPLGPEDHSEMLALAERTEPGPFQLRTPELGRFVGVRRDGRLVAMLGSAFAYRAMSRSARSARIPTPGEKDSRPNSH